MITLKKIHCLLAALALGSVEVQAAEPRARQVQQIKAEITAVVNDYAVYRDNRDAEGYANTFAEGGRLLLRGEWFDGRDKLRQRVETSDPKEITMHVVSTGQITVIDKDTATGIQYMTVYTKTMAEPPHEGQAVPVKGFVALAKYHDKYLRTKDGWKILERRMVPVFTSIESP